MMVLVYMMVVLIHLRQTMIQTASIDDGSCTFSSTTICDVPSFTEDWSSATWDTTSGYSFGSNGWIVSDTTQDIKLLHIQDLILLFLLL